MDAIILAAGRAPGSARTPTPFPNHYLPVQGRPILDWIIGALPPVDRLVVVVNYLAEQIEDYLTKQPHVRNWTTVRQNRAARHRRCAHELQGRGELADRVMVLNGDDLIGRADLAALAAVPMGILAHAVDAPESYGIIFQNPDGTLKQVVEKPEGLTPPATGEHRRLHVPERRVRPDAAALAARGVRDHRRGKPACRPRRLSRGRSELLAADRDDRAVGGCAEGGCASGGVKAERF